MADQEHLQIISEGIDAWNEWRKKNPELKPDLSGANLSDADLRKANLSGTHLVQADLSETDLKWADLRGADLSEANLWDAVLCHANLRGANLSKVDLRGALLIQADLCDATLTGSSVYGTAVWDIKMDDQTNQQNLVITPGGEAAITVDNIKVAQFIYLLLNNQEIRDVIDTITSKAVLILGRFSEHRKAVLDVIREELRKQNYLPIMFDFPRSTNQTTIETIKTLAGMARFMIADLTDAKSVLQELQAIVPDFPSLAVRLLIKSSQSEPGMLDFIRRFPWVIEDAYEYEDEKDVIPFIKDHVIVPAEAKVRKLRKCD
jgi:Pentapeptide repeats (8 copies)